MNCYLDDSVFIDVISERLRDFCLSLFSNDDVLFIKVKIFCRINILECLNIVFVFIM